MVSWLQCVHQLIHSCKWSLRNFCQAKQNTVYFCREKRQLHLPAFLGGGLHILLYGLWARINTKWSIVSWALNLWIAELNEEERYLDLYNLQTHKTSHKTYSLHTFNFFLHCDLSCMWLVQQDSIQRGIILKALNVKNVLYPGAT